MANGKNTLEYNNSNTNSPQLAIGYGYKSLDDQGNPATDPAPIVLYGSEISFNPHDPRTAIAKVVNDGTLQGLQIGDGLISWDSYNHALKITDKNNQAAHLYATGGISALGIEPEVTGMESFTISHLKSTDIKIANKSTIKDLTVSGGDHHLVISTTNPIIDLAVTSGDIEKVGAIVRADGIQAKDETRSSYNYSGKFYFDSTRYLYINDNGDLVYHNGSAGDKKVVLQ